MTQKDLTTSTTCQWAVSWKESWSMIWYFITPKKIKYWWRINRSWIMIGLDLFRLTNSTSRVTKFCKEIFIWSTHFITFSKLKRRTRKLEKMNILITFLDLFSLKTTIATTATTMRLKNIWCQWLVIFLAEKPVLKCSVTISLLRKQKPIQHQLKLNTDH